MHQDKFSRYTFYLLLTAALLWFLVWAKSLLVPMVFGVFTAFLMLPVCQKMERKGLSKTLSALVAITVVGIALAGLLWFLSIQFISFNEELPLLSEKLNQRFFEIQAFVSSKFGVSEKDQLVWIEKQLLSLISSSGDFATSIFSATGSFLISATLVPIYAFFFIYYRGKVKHFMNMVTPKEKQQTAGEILKTTSEISYKYLLGLIADIAILSVLNSIGFLALGINHAIFLGITAALLNVIPYVGVLIGSIIPVALALITKDSIWIAVGALAVCVVVQFLDNNFITPLVIGAAVSVNPLATTIALILGGMMWGLAGMMLFIPLLGVLKVVFDRVENLKPLGYLIGEQDIPGAVISRRKNRKKQEP